MMMERKKNFPTNSNENENNVVKCYKRKKNKIKNRHQINPASQAAVKDVKVKL